MYIKISNYIINAPKCLGVLHHLQGALILRWPLPHFINSTDFIIQNLMFYIILFIFYNFSKYNSKTP